MSNGRPPRSRPPSGGSGEDGLTQGLGETPVECARVEREARPATTVDPVRPQRVIGIIGGLGPYAHLVLEKKLLEAARQLAGVVDEQDYPEWILSSVPQTPDRTAAIEGSAPSPLPWLRRSLARFAPRIDATGESVPGADFVVIACNTAHHYLEALRDETDLPLLDMIGECAVHLARRLDAGSRVGVLATTGTLESGLYQRALEAHGLEAVTPIEASGGSERQQRVMEAIYGRPAAREADAVYGLKTHGYSEAARGVLLQAARSLIRESGCQAVVAGCTEVPLALPEPSVDGVPLVDPMEVVAQVAVGRAYGLGELDDR